MRVAGSHFLKFGLNLNLLILIHRKLKDIRFNFCRLKLQKSVSYFAYISVISFPAVFVSVTGWP